MKILLLIPAVFFLPIGTKAQLCALRGTIGDINYQPLPSAYITICNNKDTLQTLSNEEGAFLFSDLPCGTYTIHVRYTGFAPHLHTVTTGSGPLHIHLRRSAHTLKEVAIKQKAPLAVQRGDTLEYSSAAYKVNPDADAAHLVRKMPAIDISDGRITAAGEQVTRVLVDGIPFYGNDPFTSLKNLPADMVERVQVYTDLSDLEKLTGFRQGPGTKTINIITPVSKRNGVFGNIYGGIGSDRNKEVRYGTGTSLNRFNGQQRISASAHGNNVNRQGYTDITASAAGNGLTNAAGGGINYSDKWGRADVSANYMLTNTSSTLYNEVRRIYIAPATAGQEYEERNPTANANKSHVATMRISLAPDTASMLILSPTVNIQQARNSIVRSGTTSRSGEKLNETGNTNKITNKSANFSGSCTYTRKLRGGRSFSADVNAGYSGSAGNTQLAARNVFYGNPGLQQVIDQLIEVEQRSWNAASALVYIMPSGRHGTVKAQYNAAWRPSQAARYVFEDTAATGAYTHFDTAASNIFMGNTVSHNAGFSYRYGVAKMQLSAAIHTQYTMMRNDQQLPEATGSSFAFINMLPAGSLQYNIASGRNLQADYNTATRTPSVTDLQQVVNNTDPLHLSIGNPALRQPYGHHMKLRYNATVTGGKRSLSLMAGGNVVRNYITQATTIAPNDTVVHGIQLLRGGQITRPVNAQGYRYFNTNMSYGLPIDAIKCKLTFFANADITRIPLMVNVTSGFMLIRNADISAKLVSSISEKVDFSLTARSMVTASSSTIDRKGADVYMMYNVRPSLNLAIISSFVINTEADVRFNSGLQPGYNANFMLWNISLAKKVFKKQKGDIRLSVYDVLNRNTSVRRNISETYIQDTRSNILQRYVLFTLAYKFSS